MKLRLFCFGALCAVAGISACDYPTSYTANSLNIVDTTSVYALSGSLPSLPAGFDIFSRQPVRVDGFGAFDIAFDIVSPTQVRVIPVKLVVSSPTGVRIVGLAHSPGVFEQLLNAPSGGYETDSSLVVNIGDLLVVQTTRALPGEFCQFALSPFIYAKIAVLSADVSSRLITFEMGLDPNCGFRSFLPGIPKN